MTNEEIAKTFGFSGLGAIVMLVLTKSIPKLLDFTKNIIMMGNRVDRVEKTQETMQSDIKKILNALLLSEEKASLYSDTNKARVLQTQFRLVDQVFDKFISQFFEKAPQKRNEFIDDFHLIISDYYRDYESKHALDGNSGFIPLINECMNFAIKDVFDKYNDDHILMMTTWSSERIKEFEKECNRWRDEFKTVFALFFERFFKMKRE